MTEELERVGRWPGVRLSDLKLLRHRRGHGCTAFEEEHGSEPGKSSSGVSEQHRASMWLPMADSIVR